MALQPVQVPHEAFSRSRRTSYFCTISRAVCLIHVACIQLKSTHTTLPCVTRDPLLQINLNAVARHGMSLDRNLEGGFRRSWSGRISRTQPLAYQRPATNFQPKVLQKYGVLDRPSKAKARVVSHRIHLRLFHLSFDPLAQRVWGSLSSLRDHGNKKPTQHHDTESGRYDSYAIRWHPPALGSLFDFWKSWVENG